MVISKLGEGAEGEVMLAREKDTGKLFALKFISIKRAPTMWEPEKTRCRFLPNSPGCTAM